MRAAQLRHVWPRDIIARDDGSLRPHTMTHDPLVDEQKLAQYLAVHWPGTAGRVHAQKIQAGHSNETFAISCGDQQWVLRRPPRGPLLPTAHDVLREYRVMSALHGAGFPVP